MAKSKDIDKNNSSKKKTYIIAATVIILVIAATTTLSFMGNYVQYGYSYLSCGHAPIALRYYSAPTPINYSKPGDADYPSLPSLPGLIGYVCTEQQAKNLGGKYNPSGGIIDENGNRL
jgi:hypothetical protein